MIFLTGLRFVFWLIYNIAIYLACAYSLYLIAKRNGVRFPILAFIPIIQYYIIGSICEEYELWGYRIRSLGVVLCLLFLVQLLAGVAGIFSAMVVNFAATVLIALILHKFFYLFDPQRAFLYAILSLFGKFPLAIILFVLKDKGMLMSPGAYPYPFANRR